jgi:hypothetical protein
MDIRKLTASGQLAMPPASRLVRPVGKLGTPVVFGGGIRFVRSAESLHHNRSSLFSSTLRTFEESSSETNELAAQLKRSDCLHLRTVEWNQARYQG